MPAMFEKTAGEYASAKPCRPEGCRLGFAVRKRGGDSIECNFPVLVFVCGVHLRSSVVYFPSVFRRRKFRLRLPSRTLVLGERTLVMGVLNVTPDSFSDGGLFLDADAAVRQALEIERAGADILDIGGESTRPGSAPVTAEEELKRVLPVFEGLRGKLRIPISIDTQKAAVAEAAVAAGAEIINDISALRADPTLAEVVRRHHMPIILMHMRGTPRTMQQRPFARHVLRDVIAGLRAGVARACKAGLAKSQLLLDPGIGFGKSFEQNYELLAHLAKLAALGFPLVVGASRKAFIGATLARGGATLAGDRVAGGERSRTTLDPSRTGPNAQNLVPPGERVWGTAATVATSILGGAHIVRVHDVAEMVQVARVTNAILHAT